MYVLGLKADRPIPKYTRPRAITVMRWPTSRSDVLIPPWLILDDTELAYQAAIAEERYGRIAPTEDTKAGVNVRNPVET